jgi:uncharacterized protein
MDSLIESLIGDFHERPLPRLTTRLTSLPALPGKIDAVIGMRRSGKTFFLYQQMLRLLDQGVPKEALLYINFDDDRLRRMTIDTLGRVTDVYYRLFPAFKERRCHFYFDEIQNIDGWESYVRRLLDTEDAQITLTGSSSKLLSVELATALRGRSLSTEIFPFSFLESLSHAGIPAPTKGAVGSRLHARLAHHLRDYLDAGGFPEVQGLDEHLRTRVLQEYVDMVIFKDIVERYSVRNVLPLRILTHKLLAEPSVRLSLNKFYNDLKSQGISCTKNTLYEHLAQLVDAYLISAIPIHSRSERVRRVNPKKVYPIDPGLACAYRATGAPDIGRRLEAFVFGHLRRSTRNIEYYHTGSNFEVDFITTADGQSPALVQVAASLDRPDTRKRELRALEEAMYEVGVESATIVTIDTQESIDTDNGVIEVIPAWRFACASPL